MKAQYAMQWVPLNTHKWLFGSTAREFTLEEQAIFIRLLCYAGFQDGWIQENEETGPDINTLAGILQVPADKLKATIDKCVKNGKLDSWGNNRYKVASWEKYKLTEQYQRKLNAKNKDK